MRMTLIVVVGLVLFATPCGAQEKTSATDSPWVSPGVAHPGFDQIYWVPTGVQAEEMSKATGRLLYAVGYCADWDGY